MRKMATVEKIISIKPIPDADRIEAAAVRGWQVVVKRGEFLPGDLCVFCEIDSWVPTEIAPFLCKKDAAPKVYNGVEGNLLRTVRLRGTLSQGLILPISVLPEGFSCSVGDDVTELLGIQKWEPPPSASLNGVVKGNFPSHLFPKTDAERVQNLREIVEDLRDSVRFEVSYKLDGTSVTIYRKEDSPCGCLEVGVCSRTLERNIDEDTSTYVEVAKKTGLLDIIRTDRFYGSYAIQGEIVGPGIQGNPEKLKQHTINVFAVYDIINSRYFDPDSARRFVRKIQRCLGHDIIRHVPVLHEAVTINELIGSESDVVQGLLAFADKPAFYNPAAPVEGFVFKAINSSFAFKVINNRYL